MCRKSLISCIVPIYNVSNYLERCIESLISQEYQNIEIILVNDGSTDSSLEICEKYSKLDGRIRVISQDNQGTNIARNRGIEEARGKWIYFADGDDYVAPDIFSAIEKYLNEEYEVVMFSNVRIENNRKVYPSFPKDIIEFKYKEDFEDLMIVTMDRLQNNRFNYKNLDAVSIWNKIYRLDFLIENNIKFVPRFPKLQDMSFNLMVYEKQPKAIFVNHVGYFYEINDGSVTKKYQKDFPQKIDKLVQWFKEFSKGKDFLLNSYKGRVNTILRSSIVLYYCNPSNAKNYRIRKKEFVEKVEKYSEVNNSDISYLPFKERVLSFFIKRKIFVACCLLNKLRNSVNKI